MSHHFKIQPEAEKDLEAIWHYSVKNWGIKKKKGSGTLNKMKKKGSGTLNKK